MDDLVIFLFEKYGWGALIAGIGAYLLAEGALDIVTDWISDKRRERNVKIHPKE